MLTPTQREAQERRRRFAAGIAAKAAQLSAADAVTTTRKREAVPSYPCVAPSAELSPSVSVREDAAALTALYGFDPYQPSFRHDGIETVIVIQAAVAQRFSVTIGDLVSPCREAHVSRARQIAMYLSRELTSCVLADIAEAFGGRHHTTTMHAVRKIARLIAIDPSLADTIAVLQREVERRTNGPDIDRGTHLESGHVP